MHATELWQSPSIGPRVCRTLLIPASWLYAIGWEVYLATYRLGFKKAQAPHRPVICVGNLQVGGSGKTPITLAIARHFKESGRPVILSCAGYGSPRSESATLAPPGELSAKEWGDEAAMLRWLQPDLDLVVGRNRVQAARVVQAADPNAIMLMDDGFQHLPLEKDLTIVLDPLDPPNRHCLPAGPYREPRRNRSRADLLVPGDIDAEYLPTRLLTPQGEEKRPDSYSVLCALGSPENFLNDLKTHCPPRNGFAEVKLLPDHDPMTEGNLMSSFPINVPIVVTAKDWVKLRERKDWENYEILVATREAQVGSLSTLESKFRNF